MLSGAYSQEVPGSCRQIDIYTTVSQYLHCKRRGKKEESFTPRCKTRVPQRILRVRTSLKYQLYCSVEARGRAPNIITVAARFGTVSSYCKLGVGVVHPRL